MASYTERKTVEDFIIQELRRLGWRYVGPAEMRAKRQSNFEDPIVEEYLRSALRSINRGTELTDGDLDHILTSLRTLPATIEGIDKFLDRLKSGLVVPLEREDKEGVVKLVDYDSVESNDFVVTNQYRVEGPAGSIRADIVLLVNGIPLVLIECKSPVREDVDWTDAYGQVKRYERTVPELFKYVQFSVVTDGTKTYYFPNGFREEGEDFLGVWKDPYPHPREEVGDDTLKATIYGLLSRDNLLDIVKNFVFVRRERDTLTKVMARYMQFRAANKIFKRVVGTLTGRGREKFGLIWHWQGSGKTYTMAFAAWKLLRCPEAENPTIIIMVDRRELEEQIERDFAFLGVPMERIRSIEELKEYLRWGGEGKRGIFLVTIEKFAPKKFLDTLDFLKVRRENVVVLADEVHRTHYGKFAVIMRSVLENAFFFGFTGTPLTKPERNTFQRFCPAGELYLDRYSMLDAIGDGFTVPLSYEARLPEYHLRKEELESLIKFEEEEVERLTPEEKRELRRKVRVAKAVVKSPARVKKVAGDVASHFRDIVEQTGLKALLVTIDREACVLYKRALDTYLPPGYSEVVMTFGAKDEGPVREYFEELRQRYGTGDVKAIHQRVIERFKAGREPKILIVTDMLITGFDAPNLWVMYLDKPLREHRLLQAIARTNRPFPNKKFGLVVDYIGVLKDLETALAKFESSDARDLKLVIRSLEGEKEEFERLLGRALQIFEGVVRDGTYESLESALERLTDPEVAKEFERTVKALMKSYEMLSGDPFLKNYLRDYSWVVKVYVAYYKRFKKMNVNEMKIETLSRKTLALIRGAVGIKEIEDMYPTVSIDESYVRTLRSSKSEVGVALDIAGTLQREVSLYPNSPFFIRLSEEVRRTVKALRERKVRTQEAIESLRRLCEKVVEWKKEQAEVGKERYSIYEVLVDVAPNLPKRLALRIADELLDSLKTKGLLFPRWQEQREARRRVRQEVRIMLLRASKKYGISRRKLDDLTDRVFDALVSLG